MKRKYLFWICFQKQLAVVKKCQICTNFPPQYASRKYYESGKQWQLTKRQRDRITNICVLPFIFLQEKFVDFDLKEIWARLDITNTSYRLIRQFPVMYGNCDIFEFDFLIESLEVLAFFLLETWKRSEVSVSIYAPRWTRFESSLAFRDLALCPQILEPLLFGHVAIPGNASNVLLRNGSLKFVAQIQWIGIFSGGLLEFSWNHLELWLCAIRKLGERSLLQGGTIMKISQVLATIGTKY